MAAVNGDSPACDSFDIGYGACALARQQNFASSDIVLYGNTSCYDNENEKITPIEAHKNILASASPHLRDAFTSEGFLESGANKYNIDQIDHESLRVIVACIYEPKVYISGKNLVKRMENVLIGADYLLVPELVHACGQSLVDKPEYLNFPTCISKWLFAEKYHCTVLGAAAIGVAATNLDAVGKLQDFLSLSHEQMAEFIVDLSALPSPPISLAKLFDSAIAWLKEKDDGTDPRRKWCDLVMRHVPFQKMTTSELMHVEASGKFLSLDVQTKVQQIKEIRAELDSKEAEVKKVDNQLDEVKELFEAILEDEEEFRMELDGNGVKYERYDGEHQDDEGEEYYKDYERCKSDDKWLKTFRLGRRILAHRLLGRKQYFEARHWFDEEDDDDAQDEDEPENEDEEADE